MGAIWGMLDGWKTILLAQIYVVAKVLGDIETQGSADWDTLYAVLVAEGVATFRMGLSSAANAISNAVEAAVAAKTGKK